MRKIDSRLLWADVIRVLAMFLVVVVHVNASVVGKWQRIPWSWWWAGNIYGSLAHVCVPWLIMLSGGLLLGKRESYGEFFGKRFIRLLLPWLFWSLAYTSWRVYLGQFGGDVSIWKFWWQTMFGNFWLLPVILGLYLLTPLLRQWLKVARKRDVVYLIGLWLVIAVVNPFVIRFSQVGRLIGLPNVLRYLGYYLIGYLIVLVEWKKEWVKYGVIFSGVGLVMVSVVTHSLTSFRGGFDGWFWDYLSVGVMVTSVASFMAIKLLVERWQLSLNKKIGKVLIGISADSFGIYFAHMWLLEVVRKGVGGYKLSSLMIHPIVGVVLVSGLVFVGSWLVVVGLKKLPGMKWLVG